MKRIALGLRQYHEAYGEFPPACTRDVEGRPMHSWRVLILPFLNEQALYEQYRFDEPWDGPHNRQLADKIPSVFSCPSYAHHKEHEHCWTGDQKMLTQYVALVGNDTVFPPGQTVRLDQITDGLSETLLVVELHKECVHWLAPRDKPFRRFASDFFEMREKGKNHPGGAQIALADGSVRFISESIAPESLRASARSAGMINRQPRLVTTIGNEAY